MSIIVLYASAVQSMEGEIEKIYCILHNAKGQYKLQEITIVSREGAKW